MRIACCQIAPDVADRDRNERLARTAIAAAIADGARIVVVPELASSGYVFRSQAEAEAAATPVDGRVLRGWAQEAATGDALVIGGFAELAPDGRIFNSLAAVDATGVRAVYRKLHLWDEESKWFERGGSPAPVIDTEYGRIGLAVCYDLEFPELTRGLALQGSDLIVVPTNWPHEPAPAGGRPILHTLAASTAYLNKVFVAVCDRAGTERGLEFEGGSVIAGPGGGLLAGPIADRGVATILAECELSEARDKRTSERNDAFADRRPEFYSAALSD